MNKTSAILIERVLSKQSFFEFYNGPYEEFISGGNETHSREEILSIIQELFKVTRSTRRYKVVCPLLGTKYYNGFNADPIASDYQLRVGESPIFYCQEFDLALAVCEVQRYGKELYNWTEYPVCVTPLPSALVSQNF